MTTPETEITTTGDKTKSKRSRKKPSSKSESKAATAKSRGSKSAASTKKATAAKPQRRAGTKSATVLELLRRKEGATLAELAKSTDWQNHSIRGFLSGQVTKKMGLTLESTKSEVGERTYRIAK